MTTRTSITIALGFFVRILRMRAPTNQRVTRTSTQRPTLKQIWKSYYWLFIIAGGMMVSRIVEGLAPTQISTMNSILDSQPDLKLYMVVGLMILTGVFVISYIYKRAEEP